MRWPQKERSNMKCKVIIFLCVFLNFLCYLTLFAPFSYIVALMLLMEVFSFYYVVVLIKHSSLGYGNTKNIESNLPVVAHGSSIVEFVLTVIIFSFYVIKNIMLLLEKMYSALILVICILGALSVFVMIQSKKKARYHWVISYFKSKYRKGAFGIKNEEPDKRKN